MTAAIDWTVRLRHGSGDDWAEFTRWLEEDPAIAHAYDQVASFDRDLDDEAARGLADRKGAPTDWQATSLSAKRPPSRIVAGIAIAAAAAFALFLWQPAAQSPGPRLEVATAAGEHRTVRLADGSVVTLNGNSRIWMAGAGAREVELVRGEALFTIRHNPRQPFVLRLGEDRVEDLGTVFNVVRDDGGLRVEVADGAVRFRRGGNGLQLTSGQTLDVSPSGDAIVARKDPSAIASWRSGQLVYQAVPVANVAADLGRNLGVRISVAPKLAYQPFTGTVRISGGAQEAVPEFASTLSAHARKSGDVWLVE